MAPRTCDQSRVFRPELFLSTIWIIWKDRNALVFRNHRSRPPDLSAMILQQAHYTWLAMNSYSATWSSQPRWVRWKPSDEGWVKLNTKGSFNRDGNSASAGGLIQDSLGDWISGFIVNVDSASMFIAKLWGLREGLRLCKALWLSQVVAELDSLMAVRFINENKEPDNLSTALILEIKLLMWDFQACVAAYSKRRECGC
ncbi:hypothetical protein SLA2020_332940 [Shorea laevis]